MLSSYDLWLCTNPDERVLTGAEEDVYHECEMLKEEAFELEQAGDVIALKSCLDRTIAYGAANDCAENEDLVRAIEVLKQAIEDLDCEDD